MSVRNGVTKWMSLTALLLAATWAAGCGNQTATSSPTDNEPVAELGAPADDAEGGSAFGFEGGSALGGIDTPIGEFEAGSTVNNDDPFSDSPFSADSLDSPDTSDTPDNSDSPDAPDATDDSETTPEVETE